MLGRTKSSPARIRRDEEDEDVQKLLDMFSSRLLTNLFTRLGEVNEVMPFINFASGAVLPRLATKRLINAEELGRAKMNELIDQHLKGNGVRFWDSVRYHCLPLLLKLRK